MRNLSAIDENKDLITKEYADGRVVANPTLAGTESDLAGLQVNGTKYKIPSGGGSSVSPYTSNPAMDGTASPGSSNDYARGDHVHPSDTSRAATSTVPASASVNASTGVITFSNSDGTSLFTVALPLYNGGVT